MKTFANFATIDEIINAAVKENKKAIISYEGIDIIFVPDMMPDEVLCLYKKTKELVSLSKDLKKCKELLKDCTFEVKIEEYWHNHFPCTDTYINCTYKGKEMYLGDYFFRGEFSTLTNKDYLTRALNDPSYKERFIELYKEILKRYDVK